MNHSDAYERLAHFIRSDMRMSHIYQPVMLREVLRRDGAASVNEIARALLAEDRSQIEYYEQITKNMVGRVEADGKKLRPLGIPRIADRVVMTAAVVVLEPIFEVDMPAEQHGYRPNLSAHTAVTTVGRLINGGHTRIIDADLADYFGSIPHDELLKSVARRVSDRRLLHLIKMWLEAPVEEDDGRGGTKRTTPAKDAGRGVPQGAPMAPRTQKITSGAGNNGVRRLWGRAVTSSG
jgi:hypothetical protein